MRSITLIFFLTISAHFTGAVAQSVPSGSLKVTVTDLKGNPVSGASVTLISKDTVSRSTDHRGIFQFGPLPVGNYLLIVSHVSYLTQQQKISIRINHAEALTFKIKSEALQMNEVNISGLNIAQTKKLQPFSVDVLDLKKFRDRDIDLNRAMDGLAGIRVQENGGLGSEYNYSINGLSGKAVKFFIDGIPMESFGSSFSINNLPSNTIDRIEIYKGVVPVELGGDALGGAIHLVSRKEIKNYLELSQSAGSFNTYRSTISGRWRAATSGFTVQTNAFFNYSDNNYKVWGPTVEVAGPDGRALPGYPRFERFNDDYRAYALKAETGFTNVSWADQLLLGITHSDQERGLQTGRTMAFVYGDARYSENFLMPSLKYLKRDFLVKGLTIDLFAAFHELSGTTTDTSSNRYNWNQDVISSTSQGELNGIRNQKSIYTFTDNNTLGRLNLAYQFNEHQSLQLNYTLNQITRKGSDEISLAEWTIPFLQPQDMTKHVTGLSYQHLSLDARLTNILFVKNFRYDAKASVYDYRGQQQKELFYQTSDDNAWGFGYAGKFSFTDKLHFKFSAERTARLPEAQELLGNGNTILNSPNLKPERSSNLNASVHSSIGTGANTFTVSLAAFFRNTNDRIWLGEGDLFGTARYENIEKIRTIGMEADVLYAHRNLFQVSANLTYNDIRNRLRFTSSGAENIVFNDRLRNTPYLMGNAEFRLNAEEFLHISQKLSVYLNTHYVQEYFLGWPSLGQKSEKKIIPTQFVQDAGIGYAFAQNRYAMNLGVRNIFDKQVYDNYLLQKPGRFISLKFRCLIQ
ncbi:TonB-dependent receptor [Pedobacter deserti]|uniref:TonB-dependent receptor n=1 Tax=Pedobacter deserti TaxID=2817382 RepID=UPI00210D879E|nr:TonB-dependent receptor [Pedobacter sp. SYSU D00382]